MVATLAFNELNLVRIRRVLRVVSQGCLEVFYLRGFLFGFFYVPKRWKFFIELISYRSLAQSPRYTASVKPQHHYKDF